MVYKYRIIYHHGFITPNLKILGNHPVSIGLFLKYVSGVFISFVICISEFILFSPCDFFDFSHCIMCSTSLSFVEKDTFHFQLRFHCH